MECVIAQDEFALRVEYKYLNTSSSYLKKLISDFQDLFKV